MATKLDKELNEFYFRENKTEKDEAEAYDRLLDLARKEYHLTFIMVTLIFKDEGVMETVHFSADFDTSGFVNKVTNSRDIIHGCETGFNENHIGIHGDGEDFITSLGKYYFKKDISAIYYGIYRDNGEFDAVISMDDVSTPDRLWTEEEIEVMKKLGSAFRYRALAHKIAHESKMKFRKKEDEVERKFNILSTASDEYSSVYLIDYDYGYMSTCQLRQPALPGGDLGRPNEYAKAIKTYEDKYISEDRVHFEHLTNLKTVKSKLKYSNNYFANFVKTVNGVKSYTVFKYSLYKEEGKDYVVLSIRSTLDEINVEMNRAEQLSQDLKFNREHDAITGLYNRQEFIKQASMKLDEEEHYYMISFDVDSFSVYNSYNSIQAGDELLAHIGQLLQNMQENLNILSGRLYSDQFIVLLGGDQDTLESFVDNLKADVRKYDDRFVLNISVGVCDIENNSAPVLIMIDYATIAKRTIKDRFDKKYAMFEEDMTTNKEDEQEIINEMDSAIKNKEFTIYLQPKNDIHTGKVVGAEALARWIRGNKIISPGAFIPVFEKNGFITKLDTYVWEETLKYIRNRMDNHLDIFPISVNVSRAFMTIPTFIDDVTALCDKYGVEHKYLELELTETIFMDDIKLIRDTFNELRKRGFLILMDDFGSGYSSLNVLKDVEFDILKIDMKFFSNTDLRSQKIIETVINLSKALNIPAIAEGVENQQYVDFLAKYGCAYAQGYFYHKPVDTDSFDEYYNKVMGK